MIRPFILSASVADPDLAVPAFARRVLAAAEAAGLDLLVLGRPGGRPFDAQVLVAWAAPLLRRTAVVATVPASNAHPFHVARALASVDHLAGGRLGWSVIPEGASAGVAEDMVRAARALWDGWDSDTLVIDKASGVYLDPAKVRVPDYRGPVFATKGPVNAMRPLQGQPVLVSDAAAPLALADADVVLVDAPGPDGPARRLLKLAGDGAIDAHGLFALFADDAIDGVHLVLPEAGEGLAALIESLGALFATRPGDPPGATGTLRDRLGLPLPLTASTQRDGARVPEYVA